MTLGYLFTWMMVFLRATGIVVLLPELAGKQAPITVRMGLASCLATLLVGVVPAARIPADTWQLVQQAGGEVLLGLAFGFVGQLVFYAVDMAGRLVASEVGLSAAGGFGGPSGASDPPAAFLGAFAVILFFLFGGHLAVLSAFARSFAFAAPGSPAVSPAAGEMVTVATAHVIELGIQMAAPFLALNFMVSLAFSVLGRAVPRMSVFVISASVRAIAGIALLSGAGALLTRYLFGEFSAIPTQLLQLVAGR
jgi:flagellar biosynthetic protein FliR